MCRNIRTLHNFAPPATREEIQAAAVQYVRKISGYHRPPKVNEAVFGAAVEEVVELTERLLSRLEKTSPPKNRDAEARKARAQWKARAERIRSAAG